MAETDIFVDQPLRFSLPELNARGRLVRLDALLADILGTHNYPPAVEKLLAEALVIAVLLGSLLKDAGGQLTMQAQTENGPIRLLVCDFKQSTVRGHVQFDADAVAALPVNTSLFALFGKGFLAITFDQEKQMGSEGRYQGIVPLEGESLAHATEYYFAQSEQLPTLLRVAVDHVDGKCVAAGMIVQHLAEGEEGRERLHTKMDHPAWEHVRALGETISADELVDPGLSMQDIIWRLFHESEIRVENGTFLTKGCRCDIGHIRNVIGKFPADERAEMANDAGDILVHCEFCSKDFPLSLNSFNN
ncbi:molecular chaperone Hsp33 [Sphingorhabdus lutea]|uniref:Molecular chaperone Hsp33 n=1 Tax=Sphingorhabdus lutea TaxID=1913578 RepID=A0A1L3JAV5_9SPHN|nr:Hsp33 family molecular chaperone HslO [Sphingorhabdus lutea]APG62262.1 molecular chaperone Hsp33 [Sphingorhabdus lutea]